MGPENHLGRVDLLRDRGARLTHRFDSRDHNEGKKEDDNEERD